MTVAKKNILIVEDDEDILQLVSYNLIKAGFLVECVESGELALEQVRKKSPDLILLDIMLPGVDGTEICRRLKGDHRYNAIPIVILTARGEEEDVAAGLDLGADDYITKPFSPRILVSRLKAVLRRRAKEAAQPAPEGGEPLRLGDLVIDPGRHEVRLEERPINLTPTEFGILHFLARRPGWVFSRQQIIDAIRGLDYLITPRSIDVQLFSLRKKLGRAGKRLATVRGIGYRFEEGEGEGSGAE